MNINQIITDRFSNPESKKKYESTWADDPDIADNFYFNGKQCGGCSFYAPFDSDWGLCCYDKSEHHLETVFEHFTCRKYQNEGWGAHSFLPFEDYPELKAYLDLVFELSDWHYTDIKYIVERENIPFALIVDKLIDNAITNYKQNNGFSDNDKE